MLRINIKYIIILLFCFALAFIEGGPLFYRVFYSVAAILLISIIVIVSNRKNLVLDLLFTSNRYSAGDKISFTIVLKNKGWLPVPYLIVNNSTLKNFSPRYNGDAVYIGSRKTKNLKYEVRFKVRGIYNFGHTELCFRDTASIIGSNKIYENKVFIQVYPKIVNIPADLFKGVNLFNNYKMHSSGVEEPYVIKDNRKYKEGDNLNKINWKVSAKYNELYVKNNEIFIGEEFNFFLDMNCENYKYDINGISEEKLIDFSASLVYSLIKKRVFSNLYINAASPRTFHVRDNKDFAQLMDYFLVTKSDSNEAFSNYIKRCKNTIITMSNVAFITSRVDRDLYECVLELESRKKSIYIFYNQAHNDDVENITKLTNLGVKVVNINKFV